MDHITWPNPPDWLANWCALNNYNLNRNTKEHKWELIPLYYGNSVTDEDWKPTWHCYPSWTLEIFLRSMHPHVRTMLQTKVV